MATQTKENKVKKIVKQKSVLNQADAQEVLNLMLKKANITIDDILEDTLKRWINANRDLLTKSEFEKYKHLFLCR